MFQYIHSTMSNSQLSQRVQSMTESATIAMSQKSREMKSQGLDVINLSIGEPDFNTPDLIKTAAKQAIDDNFSKYSPVPGFLELREAICEKFERDNNLNFTPSQISVSTGAKQCIANIILALINEGDEVILPCPYWVSYPSQIKFAGGIPVEVKSEFSNNFKITASELKKCITKKTKLIIYSSPCNPSGSVFTKNELTELAGVIADHPQIMVLSDEIYEYINFTDENTSLGSLEKVKKQVITVNGLAKGYAMTGWRLGYAGGPQWLIDACNKIQGQFTSGTNTITQRAAITALKNGPEISSEMKQAFCRRRELVVTELSKIKGLKTNNPNGAFYVFPDVSSFFGKSHEHHRISTASDLCLFILEKGLVACVSGEPFGNENCIRLSYASSDEILVEALNRIKTTLALLS